MPKLIQSNDNGTQEEYAGVTTSSGAANADDIPALGPDGKLDITLLPDGLGADVKPVIAAENISAGAYIYITDTGEVANADASSITKRAVGFAIEAAAAAAEVKIQFDDTNSLLTGLTPGRDYYLSDAAAGEVTLVAPAASGSIVQSVGSALSATALHSDISANPVIRA